MSIFCDSILSALPDARALCRRETDQAERAQASEGRFGGVLGAHGGRWEGAAGTVVRGRQEVGRESEHCSERASILLLSERISRVGCASMKMRLRICSEGKSRRQAAAPHCAAPAVSPSGNDAGERSLSELKSAGERGCARLGRKLREDVLLEPPYHQAAVQQGVDLVAVHVTVREGAPLILRRAVPALRCVALRCDVWRVCGPAAADGRRRSAEPRPLAQRHAAVGHRSRDRRGRESGARAPLEELVGRPEDLGLEDLDLFPPQSRGRGTESSFQQVERSLCPTNQARGPGGRVYGGANTARSGSGSTFTRTDAHAPA